MTQQVRHKNEATAPGTGLWRKVGVAIGGTVALCSLFGGPVSGASMKPARSVGPSLAAGMPAHLWVYILGPVAGALAGAWVYERIRCGGEPQMASGCC